MSRIRYFIEVVRLGSVREASAKLNLTPSAVSRQIASLEEEAGTPLFERHPQGMALTAAGEIYARYARSVALETERMKAELQDLRGVRSGLIRVATVEGVVADVLTAAIASAHAKHAGLRFSVATMGTDDVIVAVRDGEADIGISFHAKPDDAVQVVTRSRAPLVAVVHHAHSLANRAKVSLSEIVSMPVALPQQGFGIRRVIDEQCRRLAISVVPVLESNSIEALRGFVRAGAGVTLLTPIACHRDLVAGLVLAVPISDRVLNECSLDVTRLRGRRLPAYIGDFAVLLDQCLVNLATIPTLSV